MKGLLWRACVLAAALVAVPLAPSYAADDEPASPGCGSAAPQEPGTSVLHTLTSGGRERTYQLHLPDGYDASRSWPLIVAYHGRGNTGAGTEAFSRLSTLPAVVAYPNGVVGTGDGDRQAWQGAPYAAAGVDDVRFTEDLLDGLEDRLCVDQGRVYATGKSNGAGFTGLLACRMADRFAAVAPVAGAFYPATGENCEPSRPVPVLDFHGTGDATIPYGGDEDRGLPSLQKWVGDWAERDHCTTRLPDEVTEPDITTQRWTGCADGAEVTHVAVTDGGHTWPGADGYSGGGYTTQTIQAHAVMWDFFQNHQLPRN
ncbi:poly(3-hydroxybutyrate) depolymerase [Streptomyces sp. SID14478]|uniref:alpha/beta hydrolase family esterase n=1 Tax=Streptomyces sp. SID14478 TaxID=2706073 RepID=UPI0013DD63AE|nr:PHB depolymerase family esterase [Streptomyces sp. SID14478]NEB76125.1 poly(3-hydroxybutyrate) depolymerase [Streptomyces sp. SID14478]